MKRAALSDTDCSQPGAALVLRRLLRDVPEARLAWWALLLNGAWEFLQSPLYADHGRGAGYLLWTRLHCALGDVLILLAAFWAASLVARSRWWWRQPASVAGRVFWVAGLAYTVWSEWFNTQVREAWEYAAAMPRVGEVGLAPLLQWILLPPLVLALLQRGAGAAQPSSAERRGR
jgi:hypothetical protein